MSSYFLIKLDKKLVAEIKCTQTDKVSSASVDNKILKKRSRRQENIIERVRHSDKLNETIW